MFLIGINMIRFINFLLYLLIVKPKSLIRKSILPINNKVKTDAIIVNCKIGSYNYIGEGCILNKVIMSNYCSIAPRVFIGGAEHDYKKGSTSTYLYPLISHNHKVTVIEDDVWVGSGAFIRQGVIVGKGAIIASGSVVLHNVKPYTIVGGVPAKLLKNRFTDNIKKKIQVIEFQEKDPKSLKKEIEAALKKS